MGVIYHGVLGTITRIGQGTAPKTCFDDSSISRLLMSCASNGRTTTRYACRISRMPISAPLTPVTDVHGRGTHHFQALGHVVPGLCVFTPLCAFKHVLDDVLSLRSSEEWAADPDVDARCTSDTFLVPRQRRGAFRWGGRHHLECGGFGMRSVSCTNCASGTE